MLNITLDLDTGLAKLAAATTIISGTQVPVTITTVRGTANASPGASPAWELGIVTDASPAVLMAYLATFNAENDHTFTGTLDANDERLVTFMSGKGSVNCGCEVTWTVAGSLQAAQLTVPVKPRGIPADPTSNGGPSYYTKAQVDALLLAQGVRQHALNAEDEYVVQLSDSGKVFHDGGAAAGAGQAGAWLRLPPIADALAANFHCTVLSTRENLDNGHENCIAVYYANYNTSVPFLIGTQTLGSLYSTGVGDRLRLYPATIRGTNHWIAEAMGRWQDRD